MLTELYIEKYRGLDDLCLKELGNINVIAGENNSGKTSVLEVIKSLEAPNDLRAWRLNCRREGAGSRVMTTIYDTMKSLFPVNMNDSEAMVRYAGTYDNESFTVELAAHFSKIILTEQEAEDMGAYSRLRIDEGSVYDQHEYEALMLNIKYLLNGITVGHDQIANIQRNFSFHRSTTHSVVDNVVYISPIQHAMNTLYLDSLITDVDMYEQFVEIMKEFDPDFISINSVEDEKTLSRKYVVLTRKSKEGLLLNSYGDGMKKAMLLLSAVLRAQNGILLLDEFETAIHSSVMGKIFKWMIETAHKLNVQIFMTSHSIEAISTVLKCCPELQHNMRMITLVNIDGKIKARNIDAVNAIHLMDDLGLELR